MRHAFPAALLLLAACHSVPVGNGESAFANAPTAEPLTPGKQPVRIGEGGPNFAACDTRGIVTGGDPAALVIRGAPFDEGEQAGVLNTGDHLFVCTRSMDQRWLGIVADGQADCLVTAPVESPRDYAGPCVSGWVPSARVQLTAD